MKKILTFIKGLGRTTKALITGALSVILLTIVLLIVFTDGGDITVNVETSLKEIVVTSQLRTAEYTYNSIAEAKDGETTKYYVSYKGTVKAGFDFEEIEVVRKGNVIQIIVPDIQILEVTVNPNMDYIFMKDKYDTEETYAEALELCKNDLRAKAEVNESLIRTARESAEDILKAFLKPFESQLSENEKFEIIFNIKQEVDGQ